MASSSSRRTVLKAGLTIGLGLRVTATPGAAQDDQASLRPRDGDLLVRLGDATRTPLMPNDIPLGARQTMAWALDPATNTLRSGSRLNQLLLLRLDPGTLSTETRARAADGVVAYTAICTHNGCDVDDWLADAQQVSCACHSSAFDPKAAGTVVDSPAPRALPALPLRLVDGKLVVAGAFTARFGFEPG